MVVKVLTFLIIGAVCVNSDEFYRRFSKMPEYLKINLPKYYSNPPMRFYKIPPMAYPVKGLFSYTPPPNYMEHDDPPPSDHKQQPKFHKRHPNNDGLEDKDISMLVNNLSKKDLDKIIEFAGEKYRDPPFGKYNAATKNLVRDSSDVNIYKSQEVAANHRFPPNSPFPDNIGPANYKMQYADTSLPPVNNVFHTRENVNLQFRGPYANPFDNNYEQNVPGQLYQNTQQPGRSRYPIDKPTDLAEPINNSQFSFLDSYIKEEMYGAASEKESISTFTDSKIIQEEQSPKPINLRENDDYIEAGSNKVANIVSSGSYKVENFGNLPLMDYNSKRDTVSSYYVPHYTVISPSNSPPPSAPTYFSAPSSLPTYSSSSQPASSTSSASSSVKIEPAPPISAAKEQSDAHLKATKIWTHHSRGTAYTLHDDGTLSLEKPEKTKPVYGP